MSLSTLYLLDSNMVGYIANGRSSAAQINLHQQIKDHSIAVSAIVEGEIRYGLARKPEASRLRMSVEALLSVIGILPWNSDTAHVYGIVRAQLSAAGKSLSTMDTLIAAHAISLDATLVTHDKVFRQVDALRTVDWATDL